MFWHVQDCEGHITITVQVHLATEWYKTRTGSCWPSQRSRFSNVLELPFGSMIKEPFATILVTRRSEISCYVLGASSRRG